MRERTVFWGVVVLVAALGTLTAALVYADYQGSTFTMCEITVRHVEDDPSAPVLPEALVERYAPLRSAISRATLTREGWGTFGSCDEWRALEADLAAAGITNVTGGGFAPARYGDATLLVGLGVSVA